MSEETEPEEVAALADGAGNAPKAEHEKQVEERNEKVTAIMLKHVVTKLKAPANQLLFQSTAM